MEYFDAATSRALWPAARARRAARVYSYFFRRLSAQPLTLVLSARRATYLFCQVDLRDVAR